MDSCEKQRRKNLATSQAKVLQAFADGVMVQIRKKNSTEEWRIMLHTSIDLFVYEIRIKPIVEELWENVYATVDNKRYFHPTKSAALDARGLLCIATLHYKQVIDDNSFN